MERHHIACKVMYVAGHEQTVLHQHFICFLDGLFQEACIIVDCVASNGRVVMNYEQERIWKEKVSSLVCLEGLRKAIKTSFRITSVPVEI